MDFVDGIVRGLVNPAGACFDRVVFRLRFGNHQVQHVPLACTLLFVPLLQRRADLLVVALDGVEGLVGEARGDEFRGGAQQAVADADVVVEEGERFAGFEGFKPEAHAAKLGGHGVNVHAVKAAADNVAEGGTGGLGAWFLLAGPGGGHTPGKAVGRADEKVAGADGRVADFQLQERLRSGGAFLSLDGFGDDRLQGGIEQALHEGVVRVIAAGGLALVPGGGLEFEGPGIGIHDGMQFEKAFVNRTEFLRPKVLVVDRPSDISIANECQGMDGFQKVPVGNQAVVQIRSCFLAPQEAAEGWKCQFRAARIRAEKLLDNKLKNLPEIGVWRACTVKGQVTQTANGVEVTISPAGLQTLRQWHPSCSSSGKRRVEEPSVFSDEKKQHSVNNAQDLAVEILG